MYMYKSRLIRLPKLSDRTAGTLAANKEKVRGIATSGRPASIEHPTWPKRQGLSGIRS